MFSFLTNTLSTRKPAGNPNDFYSIKDSPYPINCIGLGVDERGAFDSGYRNIASI
jgi:hypothetical protein